MYSSPGFPPAYQTSTLAFATGLHFLSSILPLSKTVVLGFSSLFGAIWELSGGSQKKICSSIRNIIMKLKAQRLKVWTYM